MTHADREAILRYPDLAQKLTEPPLSYARPEQWRGFIPPETCGQQINVSPERAALLGLAEEAHRRDATNTPIPTAHSPLTEA